MPGLWELMPEGTHHLHIQSLRPRGEGPSSPLPELPPLYPHRNTRSVGSAEVAGRTGLWSGESEPILRYLPNKMEYLGLERKLLHQVCLEKGQHGSSPRSLCCLSPGQVSGHSSWRQEHLWVREPDTISSRLPPDYGSLLGCMWELLNIPMPWPHPN